MCKLAEIRGDIYVFIWYYSRWDSGFVIGKLLTAEPHPQDWFVGLAVMRIKMAVNKMFQ